jgi:hypothetical protein
LRWTRTAELHAAGGDADHALATLRVARTHAAERSRICVASAPVFAARSIAPASDRARSGSSGSASAAARRNEAATAGAPAVPSSLPQLTVAAIVPAETKKSVNQVLPLTTEAS